MSAREQQLHGALACAVALLDRNALERALNALWAQHVPGVQQASHTAQLLCLATSVNLI